MKRFLCSFVAVSMLSSSVAYADVTIPQPPTPVAGEVSVGEAIAPLKKGQVSPFTGVLLSPEALAKIVVELNNRDEQSKIESDRARATQLAQDQFKIDELNADIIRQKQVADAEKESLNRQLAIVNEQLSKAEKAKNDMPLYAGVGVAAGAVIAILSVLVSGLATK